MFVTHLSLADFRSYPLAEVPLEAGVTVFTGANGQGKTNLVEAVEFLATLGSHRVAAEAPLVRAGAPRALVRARCINACPAGVDTPAYLALVAQGRYAEGLAIHRRRNPFALVCGRACPAFCESKCRRAELDQPIAIRFARPEDEEEAVSLARSSFTYSRFHLDPCGEGRRGALRVIHKSGCQGRARSSSPRFLLPYLLGFLIPCRTES